MTAHQGPQGPGSQRRKCCDCKASLSKSDTVRGRGDRCLACHKRHKRALARERRDAIYAAMERGEDIDTTPYDRAEAVRMFGVNRRYT